MAEPSTAKRPDGGFDPDVVSAVGKVTEALETAERARGHLYSFHQLTGHADLALDEAVRALRDTGHTALADHLERELVGRNVIDGRWTYQLVEEYDDGYFRCFADAEQRVRDELLDGRRHVHEAAMKARRRTHGHPDHSAHPPGRAD